jgi:hypothetical protein
MGSSGVQFGDEFSSLATSATGQSIFLERRALRHAIEFHQGGQ